MRHNMSDRRSEIEAAEGKLNVFEFALLTICCLALVASMAATLWAVMMGAIYLTIAVCEKVF